MSDMGRRPDGPGWYWYEGPFAGHHPADEPVRVFDWNDPDEEASGLWAAGALMGEYPIEKLPGSFTPITKPVAAPETDWSSAPEWAMWWAVDAPVWGSDMGPASWYADMPDRGDCKWLGPSDKEIYRGAQIEQYDRDVDLPVGVDWRTTLRRRPEVK